MGLEIYNQQNAISDDPYVLILKLYEGLLSSFHLLEFLCKRVLNLNLNILISLLQFLMNKNVLDFDGGEVSYYLDSLYLYQTKNLLYCRD